MFGDRLKQLRTNKKLSQKELAILLKVSPSTIGMYEQNRRDPDTETIRFLADYFEVSIDYLLCRTNDLNGFVESKLDKDNIFYKSFEEIFDVIKTKLYENGVIKDKNNIPPELMEKILKHGVDAASEIVKARQQNKDI